VKAIRTGGVNHWLADDEWTLCGRNPHVLKGGDRVDLESLGDNGCAVCEELQRRPSKTPVQPYVLPGGGLGKVRTSGPLYHGLKPRHGRNL